MGDQKSVDADIVVLFDQECSKLYFHYFFHLVFGYRIAYLGNASDWAELSKTRQSAKLIVASFSEFTAQATSLIEGITSSNSRPFILCIKSEGDQFSSERLFQAGSDEVLTLPFSLRELAYRLRSRQGEIGLSFNFEEGQAHNLDIAADIIHRAELTDIEAQVILVLMEQGGEIVTRDALSLAIDKRPWSYGNRKFDVHVARIRKKLGNAYGEDLTLRTVRSAGYQLTVNQTT